MQKNSFINRTFVIVVLVVFALISCFLAILNFVGESEYTKGFLIYDVSYEDVKLVANPYTVLNDYSEGHDINNAIKEILLRMQEENSVSYHGALGKSFDRIDYSLDGKILNVDFDGSFYDASKTDMVLRRAAVTRTFCQIPDIEGVTMSVEGVPITDEKNEAIGIMTPDSFLANDGAQINTFERAEIHLFYATKDGKRLKEIIQSEVYSSNIPLERLVCEKLINGPVIQSVYPVCNDTVKIISVTSQDGICYIDFEGQFFDKAENVSDEVLVYSFVNSLCQLPGIIKVQFLIDGKNDVKLGEMDLSKPFERNVSLSRRSEDVERN